MQEKSAKCIFRSLHIFFFSCCVIAFLILWLVGNFYKEVSMGELFVLSLLALIPFFLLGGMAGSYGRKIDPQGKYWNVFKVKPLPELPPFPAEQCPKAVVRSKMFDIAAIFLLLVTGGIWIWFNMMCTEPKGGIGYVLASAFAGYCSIPLFWPAASLLCKSAMLNRAAANAANGEN